MSNKNKTCQDHLVSKFTPEKKKTFWGGGCAATPLLWEGEGVAAQPFLGVVANYDLETRARRR